MKSEKFKLKNYTTGISGEKSINEIEQILSLFGATHIMKEYAGDGKTKMLAFRIQEKSYRILPNYEGVYGVLFSNKRKNERRDAMKNREERAYRVSWRILRDWLHTELSRMLVGQAQPDEIMLPYMMFVGEKTLYEVYKEKLLKIEDKTQKDKSIEEVNDLHRGV